jgi:hypothetical protein
MLLNLRFEDGLSAARIAQLAGFPSPFHVYRTLTTIQEKLKHGLVARGIDGSDG